MAKRPPQDARKSFEAFARIVTQFPNSAYAADAHQRMIYLRNRARRIRSVRRALLRKRGAWVAAIDRAKYALENYDGAPVMREALEIMVEGYQHLGMADLAADTRQVLAANFPGDRVALASNKPWWKLW